MSERQNIQEKKEKVKEMKSYIEDNPVVGVVDMHGLPANALQDIKDKLYGRAKIKMAKKTVLERALSDFEETKPLLDYLEGQPALILSDMNPFKLYSFIQNNKSPASASPGDELPKDVKVTPGLTDLTPGPAMGTLKRFQIQTKVTQGKLEITEEQEIAEEGDTVTQEMATLFNSLKIKPMKVGMDLVALVENGELFESSVLEIDEEETLQDIQSAHSAAFNLAFNAGYYTDENIEMILRDKFSKARGLAIEAKALDPKFLGDILAKAKSEADAVSDEVGDLESEEVDSEEESEDSETQEEDDEEETEEEQEDTENESDNDNNSQDEQEKEE